jgi:hypothetical protein
MRCLRFIALCVSFAFDVCSMRVRFVFDLRSICVGFVLGLCWICVGSFICAIPNCLWQEVSEAKTDVKAVFSCFDNITMLQHPLSTKPLMSFQNRNNDVGVTARTVFVRRSTGPTNLCQSKEGKSKNKQTKQCLRIDSRVS